MAYRDHSLLFPDYLNCRFRVALPNIVWVCDFVRLNTQIVSQKTAEIYGVKVFFLLDLSTSEILSAKPFFFKIAETWNGARADNEDRFIKPSLVAKVVEQKIQTCLLKRETSPPLSSLILHSDRGREFVSRPWHKLFEKHPILCGSMSPPFHPISNSVMERFNRTFKEMLQYLPPIHSFYTSKKTFMTDFKKRCYAFNHYSCGKRSHGLTPFWFSHILKWRERECPDPPLAVNLHFSDNFAADQIANFHEKCIQDYADAANLGPTTLFKKLQTIERNQHLLAKHQQDRFNSQDKKINEVQQTTRQILEYVQPQTKKRVIKKPLRAPASIEHLSLLILFKEKVPGRRIYRARFLVTCLILTFTGMRISECAKLTKKDIDQLIFSQKVEVFRPKTKDYHTYLCTKESLKYFHKLKEEIDFVFQNHETLCGGHLVTNYTKFMNKQFYQAVDMLGVRLHTHSFRIGRVTHWLQGHIPIQKVQKLIGHKDIKTTTLYDRWALHDQEILQKLDALDQLTRSRIL